MTGMFWTIMIIAAGLFGVSTAVNWVITMM